MDEFKKPYEYEEEKRGLLLVFIATLLFADLLQPPAFLMQLYYYNTLFPALNTCFLVLGILFYLFLIYTIRTCYKLKKSLVLISKIYLIVRVIFLCSCIITVFMFILRKKDMVIGSTYSSEMHFFILILVLPLVFELLFSALWYVYFVKSKRCKELVQNSVP